MRSFIHGSAASRTAELRERQVEEGMMSPTLGQRDIDSSWRRENLFSLRMFLLVGWLCPVWTRWVIEKKHEVWKGWEDKWWINQELWRRVSWLWLCMNEIFNELILLFSKKTGMAAMVVLVYKIMLEVSVSSPGKTEDKGSVMNTIISRKNGQNQGFSS